MAVDAFALVLVMLAVGKLAGRLARFPDGAAETLNLFVLYVCLPASVLRYAAKLELGLEVVGIALVPWAILGASIAAVTLAARMFAMDDGRRAVLLLCVPLGNTSFLGYPLTRALLGEAAVPSAVIYDQFGSFLVLSTWGLWVLARYGGTERPTIANIGRKLIRFPPLIALIVALTVMPAEPPPVVASALARVSDALLPVAGFAVGLTLQLRLPKHELAPLAVGLLLKLALLPALALGLVVALRLPAVAADAVVLECAMPPMITAGALAISARLAPQLAAALVGYGTILSLASVPAWAWLLG